jgi:hypothetical protein
LISSRYWRKILIQEEFTYTQLDGPKHIRLLKIHEGNDTNVVACNVFQVDLDQKPSFEALSYTWDLGPQWNTLKFEFVEDKAREERPILRNGKTLHVTMNRYHALTELCPQNLQVPLWADQICINQHKTEEKVAQLSIMVNIFRSATHATIWLGKLSMTRNNALDFMEK